MPQDSDDDETTDDTSGDSGDDTAAAGSAPDSGDAADAVRSATPEEDDAHRGMLGEVLGVLDSQGIDVDALAKKYGLADTDVSNMSPEDLVQLTQKLAQEHPDLVHDVAQRFPIAQGLLGSLTGGGGGGLGGLLGRFL